MNAQALADFFTALYPSFTQRWESPENYYRQGEEFTPQGVCSEFSSFFRALPLPLDPFPATELFARVESLIAADPNDVDIAANALSTCFLENISHSPQGHASIAFMGPVSWKHFSYWHEGYSGGA